MSSPPSLSYEAAMENSGVNPPNTQNTSPWDVDFSAVGMGSLLYAMEAACGAHAQTFGTNPPSSGNIPNTSSYGTTPNTPLHQPSLSFLTNNTLFPMHVSQAQSHLPIALPLQATQPTLSQSHAYTVARQQSPPILLQEQLQSPTLQPIESSQKRTRDHSHESMQPPARKRSFSLAVNQEAVPPSSSASSVYSFTSSSGTSTPLPDMETRTDLESGFGVDVRWSGDDEPEGKKSSAHKEVEKRRRQDLKTYLTQLQQLVPELRTPGARTHHSKVTVVRCAVEYIRELHERARTREKEMEALNREIASLSANQQQK